MRSSFKMRLAAIDRFARVGTKLLMRLRAKRRLEKLKEVIRGAGVRDREACKKWVAKENEEAKLRPRKIAESFSKPTHWLEKALAN